MTSTHDIRAAFDDLRARYDASGWVDQGITDGFDELARMLGIDQDTTEVSVRRIISGAIWFDPHEEGPQETQRFEDKSVERLMNLVKRGKG